MEIALPRQARAGTVKAKKASSEFVAMAAFRTRNAISVSCVPLLDGDEREILVSIALPYVRRQVVASELRVHHSLCKLTRVTFRCTMLGCLPERSTRRFRRMCRKYLLKKSKLGRLFDGLQSGRNDNVGTVEANRKAVDTFLPYHFEQGLSKWRLTCEDIFVPELLET